MDNGPNKVLSWVCYPEEKLKVEYTAHSHKMETSQMETIPYMETFLIYQTAYYIKQGGFGNFFSVKSLKWKQFLMKITLFFSFASFFNQN